MSYLCKTCNKTILLENKEKHQSNCIGFSIDDYKNLIPCEYCDEYIDFEDYNSHISRCNRFFIPTIFNNQNNINNPEDESDTDSMPELIENEDFDQPIMFYPNPPLNFNIIQPVNPLPSTDPLPQPVNPIPPTESSLPPLPPLPPQPINPNIELNFNDLLANITNILNSNLGHIDNLDIIENPNLENLNNIDNLNNYEYLSNLENISIGIDDINSISTDFIESLKCPICFKEKDNNRKTVCNHIFCNDCLSEWIKNNKKCPICMINLDEIKK